MTPEEQELEALLAGGDGAEAAPVVVQAPTPAALSPQYKEQVMAQHQSNLARYKKQQDEQELLKKLRAEMVLNELNNTTVRADFTPGAAYLSSLTGVDTVTGAKALRDQQAGVIKRNQDLYDDLVKPGQVKEYDGANLLKLLQDPKPDNSAAKQGHTNARFDKAMTARLEQEIQKDLERDIYKPLTEREQQFGLIDKALKDGSYTTVSQVMSQFARGVAGEKGVLTDQDVARVFPNTGINSLAKLENYVNAEGKADPAIVAKLQQLANIARGNASKVYGDYVSEKEKLYKSRRTARNLGLFDKDQIGGQAFDEARGKAGRFAPQTQEAAAPAGGFDAKKKSRLEELRAKQAKGELKS